MAEVGHVRPRFGLRLPVVIAIALVASLLSLEGVSSAAGGTRQATVNFTPNSVPASTSVTGATIFVRNDSPSMSSNRIGSWDADLSLFSVNDATITSAPGGWSLTLIGGHLFAQAMGSSLLTPGQYVTVTLDLVAGCTTGTRGIVVYTNTDWTGTTYAQSGDKTITVASSANVATHAVITSVADTGGVPFLSGGSAFSVGVKTVNDSEVETAPCGSMTVTLSKSIGGGTLSGTLSTVVTGPATTGTITPATYSTGANGELGVRLCVAPYSADAAHSNHCRTLDFAAPGATEQGSQPSGTPFSLTEPPEPNLSALSSSSSTTPTCTIDSSHQLCGVWVFPNGSADNMVYATYITCNSDCKGGISIKTQSVGTDINSLYNNSGPNKFYLFYLFCGSNTCPGNAKKPNGISSYTLQTLINGSWTDLPACTSSVKDMVDPTTIGACTDYGSSNRSPGSNTLMLVARFALPVDVDPGTRAH